MQRGRRIQRNHKKGRADPRDQGNYLYGMVHPSAAGI
jgi:hypothetical protein